MRLSRAGLALSLMAPATMAFELYQGSDAAYQMDVFDLVVGTAVWYCIGSVGALVWRAVTRPS